MEELKISSTKDSPEIILSPNGIIKIMGRSILENVSDFIEPVEEWIADYLEIPAEITCIDISLEYFNSATAKVLIHLLELLKHVRLKNKKLIFNWYYADGDEDILESGEYFSSILEVPFNFIKIG
jgi:hypothetical protein